MLKITVNHNDLNAIRPKTWLLALPLCLWLILFFCRALWYHQGCNTTPTPCTPLSVNAFDQIAFRYNSIFADFLSNIVQNGVGVLAFLLPVFLYRDREPKDWVQKSGFEIYLLLSATLWNAAILEICRAVVQRPRPLVYSSPLGDGANIHSYTSFYSGHTSFVALASLSMLFMVIRRYPLQRWLHFNFCVLYFCLSILTGALRVLGGRHFPTDVIFGFFAGSLIALFSNLSCQRK